MPNDKSLDIRRAIVAHLRSDADVIALVPSSRIMGEFAVIPNGEQPTFPFIRMGYSSARPFEAVCWDGSENTVTVHVFAQGPSSDSVEAISKRVINSIQNMNPASLDGWICEWTNKVVVPDDIPQHLHAIITFSVIAFDVGGASHS